METLPSNYPFSLCKYYQAHARVNFQSLLTNSNFSFSKEKEKENTHYTPLDVSPEMDLNSVNHQKLKGSSRAV